jgi:hypothetical protein
MPVGVSTILRGTLLAPAAGSFANDQESDGRGLSIAGGRIDEVRPST